MRRLHEEKFSCGGIKCEFIVVNVLAPFAAQQIFEELEKCYMSYEFVHIANIIKTRMDEWNAKSQLLKGGLKYWSLWEVNVFC
jgi:hypothetical protein